jgi:hypothetical protein
VNVRSVRRGLADNAAAVQGLTTYGFCPSAVEVPCLYAGEVTIDYDQTFGGDLDVDATCYLLTSAADDEAGQALLDELLSVAGPRSVPVALLSDPTLGGACDDIHVRRAQGYRMYRVGETDYYGAALMVRVIGVPGQE